MASRTLILPCLALLGGLLASPAFGQTASPVDIARTHIELLRELWVPHRPPLAPRVQATLAGEVELTTANPETMPVHLPPGQAAAWLINELLDSRSRMDRYTCEPAGADVAICTLHFVSDDRRCTMREVRRLSVRDGRIVRIAHFHFTGDFANAAVFEDLRASETLPMLAAMDVAFEGCGR